MFEYLSQLLDNYTLETLLKSEAHFSFVAEGFEIRGLHIWFEGDDESLFIEVSDDFDDSMYQITLETKEKDGYGTSIGFDTDDPDDILIEVMNYLYGRIE